MHDAGGGGRDPADLIASVVIPWRDEGDRGEALRYALRSLENLPHDGVTVSGDRAPSWAQVERVVTKRLSSRYEDGQANVLAGLEAAGGWVYISHDDIIVLRPVQVLWPAHRGPLALYRTSGDYYRRAHQVDAWLRSEGIQRPLNYNVHMPFLVDSSRYLDLAGKASHLPAGFRASIYGNLVGLKARRVLDPKVVAAGARPHPSWPVISMSDRSFSRGYIGKQVRQTFPNPSRYEVGRVAV